MERILSSAAHSRRLHAQCFCSRQPSKRFISFYNIHTLCTRTTPIMLRYIYTHLILRLIISGSCGEFVVQYVAQVRDKYAGVYFFSAEELFCSTWISRPFEYTYSIIQKGTLSDIFFFFF